MKNTFPTDYPSILKRMQSIDPGQYARSRNFIKGAVTRLSPYISRGVISTKDILLQLIASGQSFETCETLVRELAWRDYFQRVWQKRNVDDDLRQTQVDVRAQGIPTVMTSASTGIEGIDQSIRELLINGYMHNHCRMYVAALACNIARCGWQQPARWMYYHLLDGDWASNACSWQWVAGANSSKKYFANQENINKYTGKNQTGTFLDVNYDTLPFIPVPEHLKNTVSFEGATKLPDSNIEKIDPQLPVAVYNYYNLDPEWLTGIQANRILLLEPEIFARYPVSELCIEFAFNLASNIQGIRIFKGSWAQLQEFIQGCEVHFKEHPLNQHYQGIIYQRDWMCEDVAGYFPSFFSYWKKVEPRLRKMFSTNSIQQPQLEFSKQLS